MIKNNNNFPYDLVLAQKLVYEPCRLICENIHQESESHDYGAYEFTVNNLRVKFRVARTTPKKSGQFVTLWKRINDVSPIIPYDMQDSIDLFVVSVRDSGTFGQFVFPKQILYEKGFISKQGRGGKRAMRVYPPWVMPHSLVAIKTQQWQLLYYLEIQPYFDSKKANKLYL